MDTKDKKQCMLAFMPWVTIAENITVGEWECIPIEIDKLNNSQKEIRRILECYKIHSQCSVSSATLIKNINKQVTDILTDDERDECFLICELISFSTLSMREFFRHKYTNSASQAVVIQSFVENSKGFAVVSRRRDGNLTNFSPDEFFQILKPNHVSGGSFSFNLKLVNSLLKARETLNWINYYEGIFCYLKANTDDNNVSVQPELMFSMGAFERLLDVTNGNCDETSKKFVNLTATVLTEEEKSATPERDYGSLNKHTSVREIWIRDLCICRGEMSHGRTKPKYKSIWSHQEHLILASEIFPLIVKIKLSSDKLYEMTDEDLRQLYYFDKRLRAANLFNTSEDKTVEKFGWELVRRKAVWSWESDKKRLLTIS